MNFRNISTSLLIYLVFILTLQAKTSPGAAVGGGTNPTSQDPSECCGCPNHPTRPCYMIAVTFIIKGGKIFSKDLIGK